MGRSGDGKQNILWGWPNQDFIVIDFVVKSFKLYHPVILFLSEEEL